MIRLFNHLAVTAVVMLAAITVFIFLAPNLGYHVETVTSGSMQPALATGSVIVTGPAPAEQIKAGDIITFRGENGLTCHRVVMVQEPSARFITRGDANEDTDQALVTPDLITGKVIFSIPLIGYLSHFINTPLGLILGVVIPGLSIAGLEIHALLCKKEDDDGP